MLTWKSTIVWSPVSLLVSALQDPEEALVQAIAVLEAGGTVVIPTDTVYGVGALPRIRGATGALFALKDRPAAQPLAVLVADRAQALELVDPSAVNQRIEGWMSRWWPGPLTLVLPRSTSAREMELGGASGTVGVRCPDSDFVRMLAAHVGPIATTSANRHGEPTATDAAAAASSLVGLVDLVVDGGPAGTVASTVIDVSDLTPRMLREGSVSATELGLT